MEKTQGKKSVIRGLLSPLVSRKVRERTLTFEGSVLNLMDVCGGEEGVGERSPGRRRLPQTKDGRLISDRRRRKEIGDSKLLHLWLRTWLD